MFKSMMTSWIPSLWGSNQRTFVDPMSCKIVLAILSTKPLKTKVSFFGHRLTIDDVGLLQPSVRGWVKHASSEDMSQLRQFISTAIYWYDSQLPEINYIFSMASNGLQRLRETYKQKQGESNAVEAISRQITMLEDVLKGRDVNEVLKRYNSNPTDRSPVTPQFTPSSSPTSPSPLSLGPTATASASPVLSAAAASSPVYSPQAMPELPHFFRREIDIAERGHIHHKGFDTLWTSEELQAIFLLLKRLSALHEAHTREASEALQEDQDSIVSAILAIVSCKDRALARTIRRLTSAI